MTREPTVEMTAALQAFADKHGRNWKYMLASMWMTGADVNQPHGSYLRCLRNQFGPTWLRDECDIVPALTVINGSQLMA
jgi:hypothetical protein